MILYYDYNIIIITFRRPEKLIFSILTYRFMALTLRLNPLINTLPNIAQRLNIRNMTFLVVFMTIVMLCHNQRVNQGKMGSADPIRMRILPISPMTVPIARILTIRFLSP